MWGYEAIRLGTRQRNADGCEWAVMATGFVSLVVGIFLGIAIARD